MDIRCSSVHGCCDVGRRRVLARQRDHLAHRSLLGRHPLRPRLLLGADVVQTAFAVFWGLTGLIGMAWSARRGSRGAWFSAAALMAVVVVKLFVVDLANVGTVEGVVSFVSVGIALVAVGYLRRSRLAKRRWRQNEQSLVPI